MSLDPALTRRALLVGGGATLGAAVLAACSHGSDGGSAGAPSSDSSRTSGSTPPASSGSASGSASGPGGPGGPGGAADGDALAPLASLTIGEPRTVTLPDGKSGLLTRTSASAVACFGTVCTHEGCTVKPDGKILACPCHGSTFEAATGKVLGGPAPDPLPAIAVRVVNGQVVAG